MPKQETKARRFSMPSIAFCEKWVEANKKDSDDAWKTFVYSCWIDFSVLNAEMLNETEKGWKSWSDDQVQSWLGEKCYTKCSLLRKKFKAKGKDVPFPKGYLNRGGKKPSKRVSTEDLMSLFD